MLASLDQIGRGECGGNSGSAGKKAMFWNGVLEVLQIERENSIKLDLVLVRCLRFWWITQHIPVRRVIETSLRVIGDWQEFGFALQWC